jgi:hypothetical protein
MLTHADTHVTYLEKGIAAGVVSLTTFPYLTYAFLTLSAPKQVYASRYRPGGNLKQSLEATGVITCVAV